MIKELISQASSENDIVLDFFAGSCTSAQAVLEQNIADGGNRRYIMVQLPEPTDHKKYPTIAAIGIERIRRVGRRIAKENHGKMALRSNGYSIDAGVCVYRLDRSQFMAWSDYTGDDPNQLELLFENATSPLVSGWIPEIILSEIQLLEGFPLDSSVSELQEYKKNKVLLVESDGGAYRLFVCLDRKIKDETLELLNLDPDDVFVCLDSALTDEAKVRLGDLGNLRVI